MASRRSVALTPPIFDAEHEYSVGLEDRFKPVELPEAKNPSRIVVRCHAEPGVVAEIFERSFELLDEAHCWRWSEVGDVVNDGQIVGAGSRPDIDQH